jgi:hypothetical protein
MGIKIIRVDATYATTTNLQWQRTQSLINSFVNAGFTKLSDTHPNPSGSGTREVYLSHSDLIANVVLSAYLPSNATSSKLVNISLANGTFKVSSISAYYSANNTDLSAQAAIYIAHNQHVVTVGKREYSSNIYLDYPDSDGYSITMARLDGPSNYEVVAAASLTDFITTNYTSILFGAIVGELTSLGNFAKNYYSGTRLDMTLPNNKIALHPLYFNPTGLSSGEIISTGKGIYISTRFPEDCPVHFTLDSEPYVRNDRVVVKV